jgi:anthranilate/para-aminobenzoate synthase component I
MAVAIRALLVIRSARSCAGGDIAAMSLPGKSGDDFEPDAEFQETVNKSKAMLKAVALAETFGKT